MLSDVVGERIMTWRKRRGLNRETLAERCAYLGMNLTAESFTNIESGRRKEGVRRRTITVDELMVIARALNVPPVLLLVPLEQGAEDVELTPGLKLPVAEAVEWITGEALAFDDMADDCLKGETTPGHRMMEWTETALPLGFIRAARRELEDYTQAERSLTSAHQALEHARGRLKQSEDDPGKRELNELTVSLAEQAMEHAAAALEAARERFVDVRATFIAEGFPAPMDLWQDLGEELTGEPMKWGWGFRGGRGQRMTPYHVGFFYRAPSKEQK